MNNDPEKSLMKMTVPNISLSEETIKTLNEISKINQNIYKTQAPALKALGELSKAYNQHIISAIDLSPAIKAIEDSLSLNTKPIYESAIKAISDSLTETSYSTINNLKTAAYSAILNNLSSAFESLPVSPITNINCDYVEMDEAHVNEWKIPDEIVIPLRNNRVRISTDLFVSILINVFMGLLGLVSSVYLDVTSNETDAQYRCEQLRIEQEENQILSDIRDSLDSSNSSRSEEITELLNSIESLQGLLLSLELDPQGSDLIPDEAPAPENNNPE